MKIRIIYNSLFYIIIYMHTGEILIFYDTHFSENIEITEVPNTKYDNKMYFLLMHTQCVPIPYITSYAFANNRFAFSSWSGIRCFNLPSKLFQSCFDSLYSSSFSSSVFSTTFSFFPFF